VRLKNNEQKQAMKKQTTTIKSRPRPRFFRAAYITGLLPAVLLLSIQSSHAGSATWLATPATGDWNTAANWTAGGPPNGPADTATFDFSNVSGVSLALNTEVNGILFNTGGSALTITASPMFTLTISGMGITNNSGTTQSFVSAVDTANNLGTIAFTNSATAGSLTAFTVNGGDGEGAPGSIVQFSGTSTAANATFTANGGVNGTYAANSGGGLVEFLDSSTADNGTFTLNGTENFNSGGAVKFFGTSTAGSGTFTIVNSTTDYYSTGTGMGFYDSSTAGNGIFTLTVATSPYGGSSIVFSDSSTPGNGIFTVNGSDASNYGTVIGNNIYFFSAVDDAGNATVIANGGLNGGLGGTIHGSPGSTARIEIFGNGLYDYTSGSLNLDADGQNLPPVTVGSIEGNGLVIIGNINLVVGNNNLSTTFSGLIQDGFFGTGSLTKTGKGRLTLSTANTYTGGTTVGKGTLLVTNRTGSATGTGTVQVKSGVLGGTGRISGAVTVASGRAHAILAPGSGARPGTLTTLSALTFGAHATYKIDLNSSAITADRVTAKGVTITSGALVSIGDLGIGTLTVGTAFTIINNTAATPISGTFSNLADGSTLIVGSNTYKANYESGTGNDLTLTVQ
jgi:autotransporter-associated beta strand protein